MTFAGTLFWCC